jgi:multiple antibiotic resistance protein
MQIRIIEIFASFMVLFAIIDIPGSIPIILDLKVKTGDVEPGKTSLVAFGIFMAFLFIGSPLLSVSALMFPHLQSRDRSLFS